MGLGKIIRSSWCGASCAVVLGCAMVQVLPAKAVRQRHVELTPWEQAERGRQALEAMPEGTRTRADYARAMDGFRTVYHEAPGDMHAPDSVNAVAELLAEQGRGLHDAKSLKAAVGQYEFLRTQYPGSSLRVGALLAEGQIYENDLHDAAAARERYSLLVKEYPRSEMAEEARAGLASLDQGGRKDPGAMGAVGAAPVGSSVSSNAATAAKEAGAGGMLAAASASDGRDARVSGVSSAGQATVAERQGAAPADEADGTAPGSTSGSASGSDAGAQSVAPMHIAKTVRRGHMAQVTGIRHWSTPNYTRVAIDLGDDVTYEAARVPNPDRIYFDLHGTRLAQELVGKSFAVTDDGFLKKIRAAQFSNDMTRVVLDVNDVTEYSAFLLPNPYRLIIDIHGGSKAEPGAPVVSVPMQRAAAPAPSVPNTTAVKSGSSFDVAAVSAQPGRVEATTQPTSQPISAVVSDRSQSDKAQGSGLRVQGGDGASGTGSSIGVATSSADVAVPVPSTRKLRHGKGAKDADAVPARAAVPTADGETSMVRALGLKVGRIVIDAGHGGHDSGTLGVDGIEEKDVVLDVALRLGRLLHERLGSEIIYTRSDDTFIPLETRTAIANKAQADLFLSIHANSSSDASARGVETYYLNFTSSPDALETAARENAVSDQSIHQLSDLVKKIALKDKIAESREFAGDVEQSLYGGLQKGNAGLKDRGVKKAPFVVLIGANMPSILAEISFVTNAKDARQLQQPEYRERVAESLYKGVAKYAGGLSGAKAPTERASGN
ncbi:N-acetylmuramoyl-L-alanine amidase [Tunturiibacter gelidoferens]|uniref:N-acetylmuramoyl-L-alanine amidase n=2 Tax=Tunturiibacter gelidiferens TaxID=3069689 RepID=A0AAU7Z490_9BACT|nr:N-acetylmuramoyl-L-alanine amidase [Edaphobacter lichenicola]MBB5340184.1 N-acetylmuramoyl-L-alanine amidase [Edaphobacter lichenicola]